jgi:2-polyprenyl-6-hydroxyphenyl methylase/3-demethylubiquinone-9 3-methyltransferase
MVKPDGMFFMSTIAKTPEAYISNIVIGEYILGLLPKGTHEYELFLSHEEVMGIIGDKMELV